MNGPRWLLIKYESNLISNTINLLQENVKDKVMLYNLNALNIKGLDILKNKVDGYFSANRSGEFRIDRLNEQYKIIVYTYGKTDFQELYELFLEATEREDTYLSGESLLIKSVLNKKPNCSIKRVYQGSGREVIDFFEGFNKLGEEKALKSFEKGLLSFYRSMEFDARQIHSIEISLNQLEVTLSFLKKETQALQENSLSTRNSQVDGESITNENEIKLVSIFEGKQGIKTGVFFGRSYENMEFQQLNKEYKEWFSICEGYTKRIMGKEGVGKAVTTLSDMNISRRSEFRILRLTIHDRGSLQEFERIMENYMLAFQEKYRAKREKSLPLKINLQLSNNSKPVTFVTYDMLEPPLGKSPLTQRFESILLSTFTIGYYRTANIDITIPMEGEIQVVVKF